MFRHAHHKNKHPLVFFCSYHSRKLVHVLQAYQKYSASYQFPPVLWYSEYSKLSKGTGQNLIGDVVFLHFTTSPIKYQLFFLAFF